MHLRAANVLFLKRYILVAAPVYLVNAEQPSTHSMLQLYRAIESQLGDAFIVQRNESDETFDICSASNNNWSDLKKKTHKNKYLVMNTGVIFYCSV